MLPTVNPEVHGEGSRQQSRAQRHSAGRGHRWGRGHRRSHTHPGGRCHGRGCGGGCATCHRADADDHRDHGSHGCHDHAHNGSGHDVVPEPWTWLIRALPVTDWSPSRTDHSTVWGPGYRCAANPAFRYAVALAADRLVSVSRSEGLVHAFRRRRSRKRSSHSSAR